MLDRPSQSDLGPRPATLPVFPAPAGQDLIDEARLWLSHLAAERRMSTKTVEAYRRDLRQFLQFLCDHWGEPADLAAYAALAPVDLRAFMAKRRQDGIESRSLLRALAGLRSFARHLERQGRGKAAVFSAVRTPKLARRLPKPVPVEAARDMTDVATRAGETREAWILARDAAVLALLYGAGLRISEALGLRRDEAPIEGRDSLTVTGKGQKTRMVPIIAPIGRAIEDYLTVCPYPLLPQGPLFVGARGGPPVAAHHPARGRSARTCGRRRQRIGSPSISARSSSERSKVWTKNGGSRWAWTSPASCWFVSTS